MLALVRVLSLNVCCHVSHNWLTAARAPDSRTSPTSHAINSLVDVSLFNHAVIVRASFNPEMKQSRAQAYGMRSAQPCRVASVILLSKNEPRSSATAPAVDDISAKQASSVVGAANAETRRTAKSCVKERLLMTKVL